MAESTLYIPSRHGRGLRAPLALLALVLCGWAFSVVTVVDRGGRYADMTLAGGALSIQWGGHLVKRRSSLLNSHAYRRYELLHPERSRCVESGPPNPFPATREWKVDIATGAALASPAFWIRQRLGLRMPVFDKVGYPTAFHRIELPLVWMCIPPSLWLVVRLRRRRRADRAGLCPACEYDLTGNTSGVCPECGERVQCDAPPGPSSLESVT